jgi:ABC-type nitrate/sulfonate/bicarbonate transport system ATPase subunit
MDVIKGIDLEVCDGEFLVLVVPSGCGESTTLRMSAGHDRLGTGRGVGLDPNTAWALRFDADQQLAA